MIFYQNVFLYNNGYRIFKNLFCGSSVKCGFEDKVIFIEFFYGMKKEIR